MYFLIYLFVNCHSFPFRSHWLMDVRAHYGNIQRPTVICGPVTDCTNKQ